MKLAVISKNIKNPKSWLLIIALLYLLFRLFHAAIPEPKEFTSIYALDARASMFDVFGSVASYSAILAAFLYLAVPSKIERDGKLDFSSLNQTFLFFPSYIHFQSMAYVLGLSFLLILNAMIIVRIVRLLLRRKKKLHD